MAINTYAALSPDILLNPSPGCINLSGLKTLNSIISEIFANGEQGFTRTPGDLSTMYQDAAGTVPVTGVGQAVGLMLDKSKGLVLGGDKRTSGVVGKVGTSAINATYDTETGVGTVNRVSFPSEQSYVEFLNLVPNAIYKLTFSNIGGIFLNIRSGIYSDIGTTINSVNTVFVRASALGVITITAQANGTATFTLTSMCELKGNHAYQIQSAMRPLLVASPQRLDYDTADDKLITNLPAQLTGCTVIRSVPNVGTQILTGQTIPTTYNDNTDHCGLIVINRALTATETSQITAIFNKAAGV